MNYSEIQYGVDEVMAPRSATWSKAGTYLWKKPKGVDIIKVLLCGGGGGGGASAPQEMIGEINSFLIGGAGGGGQIVESILDISDRDELLITVGRGGMGGWYMLSNLSVGMSKSGESGGVSSIDDLISAIGGGGGYSNPNGSTDSLKVGGGLGGGGAGIVVGRGSFAYQGSAGYGRGQVGDQGSRYNPRTNRALGGGDELVPGGVPAVNQPKGGGFVSVPTSTSISVQTDFIINLNPKLYKEQFGLGGNSGMHLENDSRSYGIAGAGGGAGIGNGGQGGDVYPNNLRPELYRGHDGGIGAGGGSAGAHYSYSGSEYNNGGNGGDGLVRIEWVPNERYNYIVDEVNPTFKFNSLETIINTINSGNIPPTWNIGDSINIKLNDGTYTGLRIIDFNHDNLADGSGKARVTFDCINMPRIITTMGRNPNATDAFINSNVYYICQTTIFDLFPQILKDNIKLVNKPTITTYSPKTITDVPMKIFVYSAGELDSNYISEGDGDHYPFFIDDNSRMKSFPGLPANIGYLYYYYTRTPAATSRWYGIIPYQGTINNRSDMNSTAKIGIGCGFCI